LELNWTQIQHYIYGFSFVFNGNSQCEYKFSLNALSSFVNIWTGCSAFSLVCIINFFPLTRRQEFLFSGLLGDIINPWNKILLSRPLFNDPAHVSIFATNTIHPFFITLSLERFSNTAIFKVYNRHAILFPLDPLFRRDTNGSSDRVSLTQYVRWNGSNSFKTVNDPNEKWWILILIYLRKDMEKYNELLFECKFIYFLKREEINKIWKRNDYDLCKRIFCNLIWYCS